jgi:hypothetical protein
LSARARLARFALGATLAALAVLGWLGYGQPELLIRLGDSLFLCA